MSEPLPSNDPDFLMESPESSELVLEQTRTLRPHVFDAWRERGNYRSVSMTFFVNITGECDCELKCCALYACEHGPLSMCALTCSLL